MDERSLMSIFNGINGKFGGLIGRLNKHDGQIQRLQRELEECRVLLGLCEKAGDSDENSSNQIS